MLPTPPCERRVLIFGFNSEEETRRAISTITDEGFEICPAKSADQILLSILNDGMPLDLALLCNNEAGHEVAEVFANHRPEVPVVFMVQEGVKSPQPGAQPFIFLPLDRHHDLRHLLEKFMGTKKEDLELAPA
jgi:hypothetical protein